MVHAGCVANFIHCWEDLTENVDLLHAVQYSVTLSLLHTPDCFELNNYDVLIVHKTFISNDIGVSFRCDSQLDASNS